MNITLHPHMSVAAIAEYCERHNVVVLVEGVPNGYGGVMPRLTVRDREDTWVPTYIARQMEGEL
jgi:hypothetical protein